MNGRWSVVLLTAVLLMAPTAAARAQERWRIDFENGAAISGRNDVRIPGDSGTLFSLTDDLVSGTEYFRRVRAEVRLGPKHALSVLAAPLQIDASGRFDRPVSFAGDTFPAGAAVTGRYEFNSYRLTTITSRSRVTPGGSDSVSPRRFATRSRDSSPAGRWRRRPTSALCHS